MENLLISLLSEDEKRRCILRKYEKNDVIFHENDLCAEIGIVLSGRVDIVSFSFEGKPVNYNSLGKNEMFGNNLIFSSDPYYKGDVIVKEKSELVFINKNVLFYLLQNNSKFLVSFLNYQSDFGKKLNSKIKMLSISSAEERLLYFIHTNGGQIKYKSVTDLSEQLALKRETLSRLISKLEKKHVLKRAYKTLILI